MGLAASQARFLCITARKADCEYKSTDLAQQKLEITNQLSDISNEYASAMNATKLMWSNGAVAGDFGVNYALLMMPSAANDYNPYMITSPSGAIVLSPEYAAAAKAAGISKAGGLGSQDSRDKFVAALAYGGYVSENTAQAIMRTDYKVDDVATLEAGKIVFAANPATGTQGVNWNPLAGMGAEPLNKGSVDAMTLSNLILSETIGQQTIDWGKLVVTGNQITQKEYSAETSRLDTLVSSAKNNIVTDDIVNQLKRDKNNYMNSHSDNPDEAYYAELKRFDDMISQAKKIIAGEVATNNGANYFLNSDGTISTDSVATALSNIKDQMIADKAAYAAVEKRVNFADKVNVSANDIRSDKNGGKTYSVIENGIINHYESEIENMTIGDILSGNIVLMSNAKDKKDDFAKDIEKIFESISRIFGYSPSTDLSGQGLNVDDASANALKFAYQMTTKTYLSNSKMVNTGSRTNSSAMTDNSAYLNAVANNGIGTDKDKTYYAVSLSNMLSAFLTYYDNALMGVDSNYVVGSSVETSCYVTDDKSYYYIMQDDKNAVNTADKRAADFFDELYNNIVEHGWREDVSINDSEYLEAALKDGRYSMSSLNNDGYYYQTRYNETGYMVEVSDTDAIARAEAEFTAKKAQLTYKEDSIDIKTKKLDAEISALSTEYETVKSLISKSIEKTFSMFSN